MKSVLLALILSSTLIVTGGSTNYTQVSSASTDLPPTFIAPGLAVGIKNNSNKDVQYFYSNIGTNGQERQYEHNIGQQNDTGDGGGADGHTEHSIEFQTMSSLKTDKMITVVLVYSGYRIYSEGGGYVATMHSFTYEGVPQGSEMNQPKGNSNIGTEKDYSVDLGDGNNFHMELSFTNTAILINGNPVTNE